MTNKQRIAFNIMRGILGVIFLTEGVTKLLAIQFQVDAFARWGYASWFMYLVGALELLIAAALFTKHFKYAAYAIIPLMLGAMYTHISSNEAPFIGLAVVVLVLTGLTLWFNKKRPATV